MEIKYSIVCSNTTDDKYALVLNSYTLNEDNTRNIIKNIVNIVNTMDEALIQINNFVKKDG